LAELSKISIQLTVADLGVTEAFYAGLLDLPIKRSFTMRGAPVHLVMSLDGWELLFVEEDVVVRERPELKESLMEYPKGVGLVIHIGVKEIEDISDALENEGIDILYPLREMPYGMKELWCFDPDGYLLALEERSS
jgi:predicted enzyme related to lactoylglutathione lyase